MGRLRVRSAVGHPHDRRARRRRRGRSRVGRYRGRAEGAHRSARGDRDDHAQLRRVLHRLLPAAHPRSAPGARVEQPHDPADEGHRGLPRPLRLGLQPALRLRALARRRGRGVVDPRALLARLPLPRGRSQPERRPGGRHQREVDVRLRDADLRRPRRAAGVDQVLGTVTTGFSSGIDAGIGFDAITVALLGRSTPVGVLVAGILFGAFKAGGFAMQAANGVPSTSSGRAVAHRALHRGSAAGARDLPLADPGARPSKARAAKKKEAAR